MRKAMKMKMGALLGAMALLFSGAAVATASIETASAEAATPKMTFYAANLVFEHEVNLLYAAKLENVEPADVKVLVWNTVPAEFTFGTQNDIIEYDTVNNPTETINGTECHTYEYDQLVAKQMTDEVYTRLYAEVDGQEYYSEPLKYSILRYAYNMLGKTEATPTGDDNLKAVLNSMLSYGAAMQTYCNYKADRLATADFVYVEVPNATFEDGFNYGLYLKNETLTVTPDEGFTISDTPNGAFSKDEGTGKITFTVPATKYVDEDSFVKDNVDPADMVTYEAGLINVNSTSVYVGETLTLNTTPETYKEEVKISWEVSGATLDGNVVTFDTVGSVTLTATIACGGVSDSKTFENIVTVTENPYPVEGKAYELVTTGQYAIKPTANNYLSISAEENDAESFYFKKVDDVYYIYYMLDETSIKYVEHSSGTALKFVDATVEEDIPSGCKGWTLDVNSKMIISNVDSNRKLGYNVQNPRFSTYLVNDTQYSAVWFEEIRELTATEKLSKVAEGISIEESVTGEKSIELPSVDNKYGASIAWDEKTDTNNLIEISDYILTVLANESTEIVEVVITLTLTLDGETLKTDYIIQINPQPSQGGDEPVAKTWQKVTNVSQLVVGAQVVIVAKDYDYALGETQNNNNRNQGGVTKSGNTITFDDTAVEVLTLEAGKTAGTYAFYADEEGYLYAASSSSNYLRSEKTLSTNSSWEITIAADGTATVTAQGSNTRNVMQYNQSSSLFACYGSASQKAICIYIYEE